MMKKDLPSADVGRINKIITHKSLRSATPETIDLQKGGSQKRDGSYQTFKCPSSKNLKNPNCNNHMKKGLIAALILSTIFNSTPTAIMAENTQQIIEQEAAESNFDNGQYQPADPSADAGMQSGLIDYVLNDNAKNDEIIQDESFQEGNTSEEAHVSDTTENESAPLTTADPEVIANDGSNQEGIYALIAPELQEGNIASSVTSEMENDASDSEEDIAMQSEGFDEEVTVDDTTIRVIADIGVFPVGSTLQVERIENASTECIDLADKDANQNVAISYAYDISVLNAEGVEIQPNGSVQVLFNIPEVANENLKTNVYHTEDDGETSELIVDIVDEIAVVEADSFSLYTIEFTYDDKQYVLDGDAYVRLADILDFVGLTGNIESWSVSNPELFNIYMGNEDGIEYSEVYDENGLVESFPVNIANGTVPYAVALQPFTSEEWLNVVIDGIEYTIVVTDAIRMDENGEQIDSTVKYMTQNGNAAAITDSRVMQGPLEKDFTSSMPLAAIYIDDKIVNQTLWKNNALNGTRVIAELLVDNTSGLYAGLQLNTDPSAASNGLGSLCNGYGGLYYDFSKRYLRNTEILTVGTNVANQTNYELFPGDIVKYTLKGMVTKYDVESSTYKNYDVIITYSNLLITLCQNSSSGNVNQTLIRNGTYLNLLDTNAIYIGWSDGSGPFRSGLSYDVNVKVVDPETGDLIDGSYYYPAVDIDIGRTGVTGFANLYNAAAFNRYSEQIALRNNYGRPTASGDWEEKVWIPGGVWSADTVPQASVTAENHPYTCKITANNIYGQGNTLLIQAGGSNTAVTNSINQNGGAGQDNSFYSGFITLANNTAGGINVTGWASAPQSGGMESYILTGSKIVNHKLDASSDEGGTIYTTTTGNADGTLSGGELMGNSLVNTPHEISAASGQSVTYTITPRPGYRLKNVYVKRGDVDIMTIVNNAKSSINELEYDSDGNSELDEEERFAFELAVEAAINTALSNDTNTWNVPLEDMNNMGHGIYTYTFRNIQEDNSIHVDWEPAVLTVSKHLEQCTDETHHKFNFQIRLWDESTQDSIWRVSAKKYQGDLATIPPENSGPYYMVYSRGDLRYILGYNKATGRWDDYEFISDGLHYFNPDNELPDDCRFLEDEEFVYSTASLNAHDDQPADYLMWVYDDDIDAEVLILSNEETHPEGRLFIPGNSDSDFVYIFDRGIDNYSGKIIAVGSGTEANINGNTYPITHSGDRFQYVQDLNAHVYYDFENNPEGYTIDSGYQELQGETGLYYVLLPGGQSPYVEDLINDEWDVTVSRASAIGETFDMDARFIAAGAQPHTGVNTYTFSLEADETIDLSGCVPVGWSYEITETDLSGTQWKLVRNSSNAEMADYDGDENVEFYNTKKTFNLTVEKQTIENKPGSFNFTANIYREKVLPGITQNITITASYLDGVEQFVLQNSGNAIEVTPAVTIPSGSYTYGSGDTVLDELIECLININHMNNEQWNQYDSIWSVSTTGNESLASTLQMLINEGETTINLEPKSYNFQQEAVKERLAYAPSSLPNGVSGENGSFTFTLTVPNNTSITFPNIPYGYKYEIVESSKVGWALKSKTNDVGHLTANDMTASFINEEKSSSITVKKAVTGSKGDKNKQFKFQLVFPVMPLEFLNATADTYSYEQIQPAGSNATVVTSGALNGYENILDYADVQFIDNKLCFTSNAESGYIDKQATYLEIDLDGREVIKNTLPYDIQNVSYNNSILNVWFANGAVLYYAFDKEQLYGAALSVPINIVIPNVITFSLKDGEQFKINNVPYGCQYEINENDYSFEKYTTYVDDQETRSVSGTALNDEVHSFVNDKDCVDLTIKKETKNNEYGAFEYKIKIWKDNVAFPISQFGDPDENGYYSFTLSAGANTTIKDIPKGYSYEVYEIDSAGWKLISINGDESITNATGVLSENVEVLFKNQKVLNLKVRKKIENNATGTFIYNLQITDSQTQDEPSTGSNQEIEQVEGVPATGSLDYDTLSNAQKEQLKKGTFQFAITNEGYFEITNIPQGYYYKVVEVPQENWMLVKIDNNASAVESAGTMTRNIETVFTNRTFRKFTVSKQVKGNLGSRAQEFDFILSSTDLAGKTIRDNHGNDILIDENGTYAFSLSHGESISFTNIPYGSNISVSEADYSQEGYTTEINGKKSRTLPAFALTTDTTARFVNCKKAAIPTLVSNYTSAFYVVLACVVALSLLKTFANRKRKKEK